MSFFKRSLSSSPPTPSSYLPADPTKISVDSTGESSLGMFGRYFKRRSEKNNRNKAFGDAGLNRVTDNLLYLSDQSKDVNFHRSAFILSFLDGL